MATDTPPPSCDPERWQRVWSHREDLLKVARRRSMSVEDAEDAVQEAILRAAERPDLDDERLGAWLTTVTMRLCVDRYRQVKREAEVHDSPKLTAPGPVPVDEAVCDRAEAKWLARASAALPGRQAEALWLKADEMDVGQVARKMDLSYRTVESLLARARRTLRNSLAATWGIAIGVFGGRRHLQSVAVASAAATLTVATFVLLPYVHDSAGAHPGPSAGTQRSGATHRTGTTGRGGDTPADGPRSQSGSPGLSPSPSGSPGAGLVPGVSLPPLPTASVVASVTAKAPSLPTSVEVPTAVAVPTGGAAPSLPVSLPPVSVSAPAVGVTTAVPLP